jgi:hypothetical protein
VHKVHVLENQYFEKLPKLQKIFRNNGQNLGNKIKGLLPKRVKKAPQQLRCGGTIGETIGRCYELLFLEGRPCPLLF